MYVCCSLFNFLREKCIHGFSLWCFSVRISFPTDSHVLIKIINSKIKLEHSPTRRAPRKEGLADFCLFCLSYLFYTYCFTVPFPHTLCQKLYFKRFQFLFHTFVFKACSLETTRNSWFGFHEQVYVIKRVGGASEHRSCFTLVVCVWVSVEQG